MYGYLMTSNVLGSIFLSISAVYTPRVEVCCLSSLILFDIDLFLSSSHKIKKKSLPI